MSTPKQRRNSPKDVHTHLTIAIEESEVCAETSLNYAVHEPQLTALYREEDPLIEFNTYVRISGVCVAPRNRAGDPYRITLYGDNSPSRATRATLRDVQEEDQYGTPQYRSYRGQRTPIFNTPQKD